jgi:hypothetical protein
VSIVTTLQADQPKGLFSVPGNIKICSLHQNVLTAVGPTQPDSTGTGSYFPGGVNPFKPSVYFMYHQGLTFKNSTFCPHCAFMASVRFSESSSVD